MSETGDALSVVAGLVVVPVCVGRTSGGAFVDPRGERRVSVTDGAGVELEAVGGKLVSVQATTKTLMNSDITRGRQPHRPFTAIIPHYPISLPSIPHYRSR